MTDDRGRGRRRQLKTLKTSGFFNAGLTPCSHTTTTKDIDEYSPPGEYLINNITITPLLVLLK